MLDEHGGIITDRRRKHSEKQRQYWREWKRKKKAEQQANKPEP
jgi:hypothetical protein